MAALVWRHGRSKAEAVAAVKATVDQALTERGLADAVTWTGARVVARYGPFGSVLRAACEVTDDAVIIECGGLAGGRVLTRCRRMLSRLFPGGEQA